jgi:hypothetical protein
MNVEKYFHLINQIRNEVDKLIPFIASFELELKRNNDFLENIKSLYSVLDHSKSVPNSKKIKKAIAYLKKQLQMKKRNSEEVKKYSSIAIDKVSDMIKELDCMYTDYHRRLVDIGTLSGNLELIKNKLDNIF